MSRKHESENTPPSAKRQKVHDGIQGASRRRRARDTGGAPHPRYAAEHARHKPRLTDIDDSCSSPEIDVPEMTFTVSTVAFSFPRYLARPIFSPITRDAIYAVAPELVDTALYYIRDGLELLGPEMLRVLAGVQANSVSNVLLRELEVVINDISSDLPTHMLAIYSRNVPAVTKRRVTLFPIHDIILATHCANLPILEPPTFHPYPAVPGTTISIPVVPLCIPAPDVFPQLSTFLYTKRVDHLLATLLPLPVPPLLYLGDPTSANVLGLLQHFTSMLAASYSPLTLLERVKAVNGLWRNVCALGINDAKLWCALDVAWEILVVAFSLSSGRLL